MNVALTKELERGVQEQVKTGLYSDADEVIRNAIRQTYCSGEADPYLDSKEIAEKIRHARKGKYQPHRAEDFDQLLRKVITKNK